MATRFLLMHPGEKDQYVLTTDSIDCWRDDIRAGKAKPIGAAKAKPMLKEEALARLHKLLKPGDTVFCVLRKVSRSGMYRVISFFTDQHHCLDGLILDVDLGDRRNGGVGVSGCGMDMGFSVVYSLGATMWPKGTPEPHGKRNGEPDSDGGYALKHRWL